jgi:hypothetical protein
MTLNDAGNLLLIRLWKVKLNITNVFIYIKVCIGKNLSDTFPIQNNRRQRVASSPLLFNFALECAIRKDHES